MYIYFFFNNFLKITSNNKIPENKSIICNWTRTIKPKTDRFPQTNINIHF